LRDCEISLTARAASTACGCASAPLPRSDEKHVGEDDQRAQSNDEAAIGPAATTATLRSCRASEAATATTTGALQ
jgi:hypothetical protein